LKLSFGTEANDLEGVIVAELIKSFAGIFLNRNSGYKPFNTSQFKQSIDEIAISQTINL
jgi:hypothetical protein